jgi:hypothetical protein
MIRPAPCLLLCLALAACAEESSPEDEVRAVVVAAEEAAEARDASALFELIAPDYQDARGNAAEEIRRHVRGYLVTHQSIRLLTRVDGIEILASDLARLRATVGMLGREAGAESSWDLAGDVYEFDVTLAREGGEWLVTRAEWRRALAN